MVKVAFFDEHLDIPEEVNVKVEGNNQITVEGPEGGPITKDFSHARGIRINVEGDKIYFRADFPRNTTLSLVNTIINIIKNLIVGVQKNYKYVSKVCYSHFPCSVRADERKKIVYVENFLGERAPRKARYGKNVKVEVDGDDVYFIGPDKEELGQAAANVKRSCRIRKKDPRVFQDGVYLFRIQHGDEITWQIK
ncbi:MAG: 50S ribosomal protein L6 [Candidatus Lokiarchaeota archaeon]|nr:50S ribosomal protein L6 [Candidatus Lokiarchaeota archaeon]MBD3338307.1 50S ribosomal protein L6 [Candidatus Lokiarchaeota archaeon]